MSELFHILLRRSGNMEQSSMKGNVCYHVLYRVAPQGGGTAVRTCKRTTANSESRTNELMVTCGSRFELWAGVS